MDKSEALACGYRRYFTGKPCKRGHVCERYTSTGHCVTCMIEGARARYYLNAEDKRAKNRAYYAREKDKINKATKRYREEHLAEILVKDRQRYAKNKVAASLNRRMYRINNRGAINAKNIKRKKHVAIATPAWLSKEHVNAIRRMYAKAVEIGYHVDHIVPLRGKRVCGLHVPWNLQLLTPKDNMEKHNSLKQSDGTSPQEFGGGTHLCSQ